jgi:hypothetical protein
MQIGVFAAGSKRLIDGPVAVVVLEITELRLGIPSIADPAGRPQTDCLSIAGPDSLRRLLTGHGRRQTIIDEAIAVVVLAVAQLGLGTGSRTIHEAEIGVTGLDPDTQTERILVRAGTDLARAGDGAVTGSTVGQTQTEELPVVLQFLTGIPTGAASLFANKGTETAVGQCHADPPGTLVVGRAWPAQTLGLGHTQEYQIRTEPRHAGADPSRRTLLETGIGTDRTLGSLHTEPGKAIVVLDARTTEASGCLSAGIRSVPVQWNIRPKWNLRTIVDVPSVGVQFPGVLSVKIQSIQTSIIAQGFDVFQCRRPLLGGPAAAGSHRGSQYGHLTDLERHPDERI